MRQAIGDTAAGDNISCPLSAPGLETAEPLEGMKRQVEVLKEQLAVADARATESEGRAAAMARKGAGEVSGGKSVSTGATAAGRGDDAVLAQAPDVSSLFSAGDGGSGLSLIHI